MTTGTVIIKRAAQKIGAPTTSEAILSGMEQLNSMMEGWLTDGIQIGFTPLSVPADDLNEPPDAFNAIVTNLAIELAPDYDNGKVIVSQDLRRNATVSKTLIRNHYQRITVPGKIVSSTLPRGAGNRDFFRGRQFFGKGQSISENS